MQGLRKGVLVSALALYAAWMARHAGPILKDDTGLIVFCLSNLLAAIILFRRKPGDEAGSEARPWRTMVIGAAGAVTALAGLIAPVKQLEWLGLLAILYACLRWALPGRSARDLRLAILVLYWANPLPSVVIGRLQLTLQSLSIAGTEWLLQALNIRVWADGFMLRTGYGAFEVPEACSGLRAASTVFVSVLGVGILLRFRWWEGLFFLLLGLVQVVALNILRIGFTVYWAARMPPEWAKNFLHDTLGIFLLVAVFLIQVEASWWKARRVRQQERRERVKRGELEGPERITILPGAWRRIATWWLLAALVVFVGLGTAFALYKHRPFHRAAMISDVIDVLAESDPEAAERGVNAALALRPGDAELLEKKGAILLRRNKYVEALEALVQVESPSIPASVMKSWALMATKRPEEAVAVVASLPPAAQALPAVAMVKAEYAAMRSQPTVASSELRKVGRFHFFQPRIRALFPFLAAHEQWETIVAVDARGPYPDATTALIGLYACIRMNDLAAAGDVMRRAAERWPEEVRFLAYYFLLALDRPGGEWDAPLARNLIHNLPVLSVDALATHLADAFRLGRPDLAWLAFDRLRAIDPRDPSLDMALAEFGPAWFVFRKHTVGIQDRDPMARIDLRPLYRWSSGIRALDGFWRHVPQADELAGAEVSGLRRRHIDAALDELLRREAGGKLGERLEFMIPNVLAAAERYADAQARLEALAVKYPGREGELALRSAFLHHAQGKWQEAYEQLLRYESRTPQINLRAGILKVNTLMSLGYGAYALDTVTALRARYPEAFQLDRAESAIWDVFGFKEEALFILNRAGVDLRSRAAVQLLYDTGRIRAAEQMSMVHGVRIQGLRRTAVQPLVLPPAESSIARQWDAPLSEEEMDRLGEGAEEKARTAVSPLVRDVERLKAVWLKAHGSGEVSSPEAWAAVARNDDERSVAWKELTMLLARQKRYDEALAVCRRSIDAAPTRSVMRWRIALALSEGAPDLVATAREQFPDDPEIWLADLVVRMRGSSPTNDWLDAFVATAAAGNRFSPGTLVRAGEFLMRKGALPQAAVLAKAAIQRGQGLVAADVLGLYCALNLRDVTWASACALAGVEHAENPVLFYKALVMIKARKKETDADLVRALEYLREHSASQGRWSERLAQAYFERGDMPRALSIFSEVISDDLKGTKIKSLLMAAEAARLQGDAKTAIVVLESAGALYPNRVSILNNLVYNLAQNPQTLAKAVRLLPQLVEMGGESFAVMDTVATVYLKSGDIEKADTYMKKALKLLGSNKEYGAIETRLNAAEIDYRMGRFADARAQIKIIQAAPDISTLVDTRVRDLLLKLGRDRPITPR